jgi:type III pantothenate kinase
MLLTLKANNSTIGVGVFEGEDLVANWNIATRHNYTPDELGMSMHNYIHEFDLPHKNFEGFIINSVVPQLNWALTRAGIKYFEQEPIFLSYLQDIITFDVREPERVGADRIADCIAGLRLYGGPLLILDFGTATTFNLLSKEGVFLGGAIAPTMQIAAANLVQSAAQLFDVQLDVPPSVIGKDTEEHLQAGIVLGFLELVEGLIKRFQSEYDGNLRVVATGGRGEFFKRHISDIEIYDEHLALKGLRIAWQERK